MTSARRQPIEVTGKTVDDAVQRALRDLGLSRSQVSVTVLSEGRPGILGIGATEARVRVAPLPAGGGAEESEPEVRPLPKIDDYSHYQEAVGPGRRGEGGRGERGGRHERGGRGERRGRGEPGERSPAQGPLEQRLPFALLAPPSREADPDPVQHAIHVLTDLLHLMGVDAEIHARAPETPMDGVDHAAAVLDVTPAHPDDDLGLLIGRRGESLAALQYVVNLIGSRRFKGQAPVTVDVHHYKRNREEALNALAQRLAARVRENHEPVALEPMPPAERRIVHLALAEDPEVATESVGEGDARKVMIVYRG